MTIFDVYVLEMLTTMASLLSRIFSYKTTIFLAFIILLPHMLIEEVASNLDTSWRIGLSLGNLKGLVFGKDIVFTYGPLHFLITKIGVLYSYKWIILIFELTTICYTVFIFARIYKHSVHPLTGFLLVAIAFLISDRSCDYYLLFIFLYAVYQVIIPQRLSYCVVMVLISVLTFYIKINFGFINFFVMFVVFLYTGLNSYKSIPIILFYCLLYLTSTLILSYIFNVDIIAYLKSGIYIINGYNDAMMLSFSLSDPVDVLAMLIVFVFCGLLLTNWRFFLQKRHLVLTLIFCFYYFLFYKNGFVRVDHHIYMFIFNSLIIYVLMYIWNQELKYFGQFLLSTVVLAFVCIGFGFANYYVIHQDSEFNPMYIKNKLNIWRYPMDVVKSVKYKSEFNQDNPEQIPVADEHLKAISTQSVDVLPENICLVYRYDLNYNPRPVFQSYSAYSLYLDSLNYMKYSGPTAPDFLLFYNKSIDNRVSFWDESLTKRAIYNNYELSKINTSTDSSYLLFQQRKNALKSHTIDVSRFKAETNSYINVPLDTSNIYLYADVKYSIMGNLRRLLFQAPLLEVELSYSDGSHKTYRCIPKILLTGVLINKSVETNRDAYHFYKHEHDRLKKIVSFKLIQSSGFESSVSCRFVKMIPTSK